MRLWHRVLCLAGVVSLVSLSFAPSPVPPVQPPVEASADPCATLPLACGLGLVEESLIVAAVEITTGSSVLSQVEQADELREAIATALAARDVAQLQLVQTVTLLNNGSEAAGLAEQYHQLISAVASAESQLAALRADLFEVAVAELTVAQIQTIENCRASFGYGAPPEFSAVPRAPEQWAQIVEALRAQAFAEAMGEPLGEPHQALLAAINSEPEVIAARLRLESDLPQMTAIFLPTPI